MENIQLIAFFLAGFAIVTLASQVIGGYFAKAKLPLISGFLFTGILAGPFFLKLISKEAVGNLQFVDETALAFIAFAAGGELDLKIARGYLRSILSLILSQTFIIIGMGTLAFVILANQIPFMRALPRFEIIAAAILGASIMVARSPSSLYAVIKEIRAKGPFTQKVLGTTVLTDAVVIILFAIAASVADVLLQETSLNASFLLFVVMEILIDVILGLILGVILRMILAVPGRLLTGTLILLAGFGVFFLSKQLHHVRLGSLTIGFFSEPLLICMTAGFYVANFTPYVKDFHRSIEDLAPMVLVVFFTLVGASLEIEVFFQTWVVALILMAVRVAGIFLGSFIGGAAARDPMRHNVLFGLAFITQAGVSVGLAKEIGAEFQPWGNDLATLTIGIIVISQIIGPPLLKWSLSLAGEAHPRSETPEFDGGQDAVIFGLEGQSLALARQLEAHGWQVKIVSQDSQAPSEATNGKFEIVPVNELSLASLQNLELEKAEAVVALLSDEENYQIAELVYENFGTRDIIVRLNDRGNFDRFHELGALIVDPGTAIVSLLDHLVRSPVAASLILGTDQDQDIIDIEMRDPLLDGVELRDIRLPLDTLIISVSREDQVLVSHGYTRLKVGDVVTVFGSRESLEEVALKFRGFSRPDSEV